MTDSRIRCHEYSGAPGIMIQEATADRVEDANEDNGGDTNETIHELQRFHVRLVAWKGGAS